MAIQHKSNTLVSLSIPIADATGIEFGAIIDPCRAYPALALIVRGATLPERSLIDIRAEMMTPRDGLGIQPEIKQLLIACQWETADRAPSWFGFWIDPHGDACRQALFHLTDQPDITVYEHDGDDGLLSRLTVPNTLMTFARRELAGVLEWPQWRKKLANVVRLDNATRYEELGGAWHYCWNRDQEDKRSA